nr:MHC class II antigen alpha [Pelodiscus sinensis]
MGTPSQVPGEEMGAGRGGPPMAQLALLTLLALPGTRAVKVEHTHVQADFYLRMERPQHESGQVMFEFDQDEILHVDLDGKEAVWRLPQFTKFASFEAQGALGAIATDKHNLDNLIKRSNYTRAQNVPPEVTVFPEDPVELGEPNVLICFADKFSPPALSVTWLRNGQEVAEDVYETDFYPRPDHAFRKFSYLPFLPRAGDVYTCRVQHVSLPSPLEVRWEAQSDSARSKMLTGVGGFVLGLIFLVPGLVVYLRNKKGRPVPQPAGLLS